MEWLDALARVLHMIETHLTTPLTVELLAKEAGYSPFYLQRLFAVMTGDSLMSYVRARRLTVAGQALQRERLRVLDASLRFGWESPESFEKAFRRFHGVTASAAARPGTPLRCVDPLHIEVTLTGGRNMDYRLEEMQPRKVLGMERRFRYDNAFGTVPGFWDDYRREGLHCVVPGYLGVCVDDSTEDFGYLIGCFYEEGMAVPEGFVLRELPGGTWAKFSATGPMPGAIQAVNRQIFTRWLPENPDWEAAQSMNVEYYDEGDMSAADYHSEIWLPVKRKHVEGKPSCPQT